jgi:hypothetical protein
MKCLACNVDFSGTGRRKLKKGFGYYKCPECGSIFTPKAVPLFNDNPEERVDANPERVKRLSKFVAGGSKVLDFGCRDGNLVKVLFEEGYLSHGVDISNNNAYPSDLPKAVVFDAVVMVEVVEHLKSLGAVMNGIKKVCKKGAIIMIESSFSDWIDFDKVKDELYVNPEIGHQCIFSHTALIGLMKDYGFDLLEEINRNVFIFESV